MNCPTKDELAVLIVFLQEEKHAPLNSNLELTIAPQPNKHSSCILYGTEWALTFTVSNYRALSARPAVIHQSTQVVVERSTDNAIFEVGIAHINPAANQTQFNSQWAILRLFFSNPIPYVVL